VAEPGGLLLLSAASRPELIRRARAAQSGAPPLVSASEPHRLAIVADDAAAMADALEFAVRRLETNDKPRFNFANRVFYAAAGGQPPAPIALMFPGFGARHPTLVADLIGSFPVARQWFDALPADIRGRLAANPLLFSSADRPAFAHAIEAALAGSLAMHALIAHLCPGLRPAALVGHSYGETAMLLAAGMVRNPAPVFELLGKLWDTLRASGAREPVEMLAVNFPADDALDELCGEAITIALDNCPRQKMLCGGRPAMTALAVTLRDRGVTSFPIPELTVPVHTGRFPISPPDLAAIYAGLSPTAPKLPAYSCATAAPFPDDPAAIRQVLCEHWFRPVRFRETIERLYADGIRTFVEVGPGGHLIGFVRDTLRGRDAAAIATNLETRGTLAQLRNFLAQMFVRGHDVDPRPFQVSSGPAVPSPKAQPPIKARQQALVAEITRLVAVITEMESPDLIDPRQGFFDLGLDSLRAVELMERLQTWLGRSLSATLIFDYPNIEALAVHLVSQAEPKVAASAAASATDEGCDVAIVGMSCRFPGGASSPAAYWDLLQGRGDAIREIPDGRWDLDEIRAAGVDPDSMPHIFRAGFLDEIRDFDCAFFGISRREALTLDPQQRLLLELSREALEDAAIAPASLRNSATGVFVGISNADYAQRLSMVERIAIGGYVGTGNTPSTAAGRLSFVLGLNGPCLAVDTACSSSLVAVHLACRSLRDRESRLALAGGVNLLVSPETSILLTRAGALSPDSRCKTFDAGADGYVRGEGGGVVALKRLADALADGDRVLAVIRGSAMNHDGRTSGFTVPNGPAQQAVIRNALADAGLGPDDVDFLEAHGTGTALGDPIEVSALGEVFGPRADGNKLLIGSVKTNIGHLEAAAGLASLIKVVLQLDRGVILASRNFENPSGHINWDRMPLAVADRMQPLPQRNRPRVAGVSSFGISGTNAHVVVAEAPLPPQPERLPRARHLLTVSARSQPALDALAAAMPERLAAAEADFADLCATSNLGRDHLEHRLCVTAADPHEAAEALPRARASVVTRRQKLAFLFSGQGSQLSGMGRGLFAAEPVFRAAIKECERLLGPHLDLPVTEILFGTSGSLNLTAYTQPALFTLQYGLLRLWQSWGVEPDMVLGHSIGEYAAACAAGMFDLSDGLRLVAARGRLMQALPESGAMIAAALGESAAEELLQRHCLALSIAAVNGSSSVVLSGAGDVISQAEALLRTAQVRTARLAVSHAFHSQLMEPVLADFRRVADSVAYRPSQLPFVCNLTGHLAEGPLTGAYWTDQLRHTVRFADGVETLRGQGCSVFVEIGPRPVLTAMARVDLPDGVWLASLFPPSDEQRTMLDSLASLHLADIPVDWAGFHAGRGWRKVAMPTTPFDRQRLWIERGSRAESARPASLPDAAESRAPAPRAEAPVISRVRRAPESERDAIVEDYLRRMLSAVLGGTAPVTFSLDEPLNRFGLDSLMALGLRNELAGDFGLEVKLTYLVRDATLAKLMAAVLARILDQEGSPRHAVVPSAAETDAIGRNAFPLSYGQRALFFLWKVAPDSSAYSLSLPLHLGEAADAGAWHSGCRALVACHPLLRARFRHTDDGIEQRAEPAGEIDWAELATIGTDAELASAMAAAHALPFDLETGPPIRFRWFSQAGRGPVLLITMHHIVSDGWSLEIVRRQLPVLVAGKAVAPPASYRDHVRSEAEMLGGTEGERLWRYWQAQLAGPLPLLDLPCDIVRPASKSFRGEACSFVLPGDLGERVKALARSTGATPYVAFLSAFLALLHRYSGQDDILVGSPQAGRHQPGTAGVVGYFVDPIVIRSRLEHGMSFRDLLAQTRQTVLEALDHAAFPFALLVERLGPERDPSRSPLFDVSFNFLASLPEHDSPPTAEIELAQGDGKFDLTLNIRDGSQVSGWIGFDSGLFERATIERLVRSFVTLLGAATHAADRPVAELPLVDGVFAPVLSGKRRAIPGPVYQQVGAHAAFAPNAPAVVAPDDVLTYRELDTRAECLCNLLQGQGVAPGSLVGVLAERSAAVIVAILAIQRAGGAVALLDPRWPAAMLAETVRRASLDLLIGKSAGLQTCGVPLLDPQTPTSGPAEAGMPGRSAGLDDLAYVVFTSGTTGTPKGVCVDQRALANYVADMTAELGVAAAEGFAVVSTLAADLGFTMVFPALASGGCLHVLSEEACHDPALFADYLSSHKIEYLKIVPSHFAVLGGPKGAMPRKALVIGGERASPTWVRQLRRSATCRIINHYGPTEATIGVLTGTVDAGEISRVGASLPLRRAIANSEIYLLDPSGTPVPPGAVGELVIGGPCLARGYLGAPGNSADGFVMLAGKRLYRTGDLARELSDGGVEILGRRDRQLKLRGLRIEPAHVEAALRAHRGVRDAIVVPDADGSRASRLLGFVVPEKESTPAETDLMRHLHAVLPVHMVPSQLMLVDALPLTANGKTDVAALRRRVAEAAAQEPRILPRDPIELALAQIWSDVLGVSEVGIAQDFFRLGGHSLLAVQLVARMEAHFGRRLPLAMLVSHPTIERLAAVLRKASHTAEHQLLVSFGSTIRRPPLFLLPGAGGSLTYLVPLARRLGSHWPCWGLQALGYAEREAIPQRVEDIAAHYVALIRAHQPRGPYHLAGHSFGALVAYEMTRLLQEEEKETVAFLGLIDNAAPNASAPEPERGDAAWLNYIALRIGKLTRAAVRLDDVAGRDYQDQLAALIDRLAGAGWLPEGVSRAQFERFVEIYKANARAAARYRPKRLRKPAGAAVIRATAEDEELRVSKGRHSPTLGWERLLPVLPDIVEVPGTHLTMFAEPHCNVLADELAQCLARTAERAIAAAE
jgi:amino acid adenylation domain-containing protein